MVRGTFSPARAWRPAAGARLARTLGRIGAAFLSRRKNSQVMQIPSRSTASFGLTHSILLLSGCVTPNVVHVYDPKCQIMTRKVELTLQKVQALDACSNHECAAQVLGGAVSLAASTVVSGSVALVGNVAFWLEKSVNCKAARKSPAAIAPVPAAPSASAAGT